MLSCMPTYSIPRKKARLKVEKLSSGTREFQALNKTFFDSILSRNLVTKSYFVEDVFEVYSPELEAKFNRQRRLWKENGYSEEMIADNFGFLNMESQSLKDIGRILNAGIAIGNHPYSVVCDPELVVSPKDIISQVSQHYPGVQLSRHADITSEQPLRDGSRSLLVFKFMKGKVKTVEEQMEHLAEMKREPQLGFDTLTPHGYTNESSNLFLSKMYYIYHFERGDDITPMKLPPQVCPIAIITYKHASNQQSEPLNKTSFDMEGLLKFVKTGRLPITLIPTEPKPAPAPMPTVSAPKKSAARKPSTFSQPAPVQSAPDQSEASTELDEELYVPTDDMRQRPAFAKLDRESRKWSDICAAFMEDVTRDGDFLNIVEIHYIMAHKLKERYDRTKAKWTSLGYPKEGLVDAYGYTEVTNHSVKQLGAICCEGIEAGNIPKSLLSQHDLGVQLAQHPDRVNSKNENAYERVVLMMMYMPGRQKETEEIYREKELGRPLYGYDSIVSNRRHLNSSHLSQLTYLYGYTGSQSVDRFPSHIHPVAFVRVRFRKGLKFKIPVIQGPNIDLLVKCMKTVPQKPRPAIAAADATNKPQNTERGPVKKRDLASYFGAQGHSSLKPTDHRAASGDPPANPASLPIVYTPGMLRSTHPKKTKYQIAQEARESLDKPSTSISASASEDITSLNQPGASTSQVTKPAPKPFMALKEKLAVLKASKQVSTSSVPEPTVQERTAPNKPPARISKVQSKQTVKTGVISNQIQSAKSSLQQMQSAAKVKSLREVWDAADSSDSVGTDSKSTVVPTQDTQESSGSDSDDSDVAVPKLPLRRPVVVSSETESDTESPTKAPRRRSQRIIDSDSEMEDNVHKKPTRARSKFRRVAGLTQTVSYLSDARTMVLYAHDAPIIEEMESEDTDLSDVEEHSSQQKFSSERYQHPLLQDCKVLLTGLQYRARTIEISQPLSLNKVKFESINFDQDIWDNESDQEESSSDEEEPAVTTVKKPVKTYGSRTSVVQASIADEYPSVDSPASVASMDSNESSKSDAIAKAVKDKLQSRDVKRKFDAQKLKAAMNKTNEQKSQASTGPSSAGKDKPKSEKAKQKPTTPAYEEVDMFASVRGQVEENLAKKSLKRRLSKAKLDLAAYKSGSAAREGAQAAQDEPTQPQKKTVRFNMALNTHHSWEIDRSSLAAARKQANQENVAREALPMKGQQREDELQSPSTSAAMIAIPNADIDAEALKPVIDSKKGYATLPPLPFFVAKPTRNSLPGAVPREPDQVGYVPSEQQPDVPPVPKALLELPPQLRSPGPESKSSEKATLSQQPSSSVPQSGMSSTRTTKSRFSTEEMDIDAMLEAAEHEKKTPTVSPVKQPSSEQISGVKAVTHITSQTNAPPVQDETVKQITETIGTIITTMKTLIPQGLPSTCAEDHVKVNREQDVHQSGVTAVVRKADEVKIPSPVPPPVPSPVPPPIPSPVPPPILTPIIPYSLADISLPPRQRESEDNESSSDDDCSRLVKTSVPDQASQPSDTDTDVDERNQEATSGGLFDYMKDLSDIPDPDLEDRIGRVKSEIHEPDNIENQRSTIQSYTTAMASSVRDDVSRHSPKIGQLYDWPLSFPQSSQHYGYSQTIAQHGYSTVYPLPGMSSPPPDISKEPTKSADEVVNDRLTSQASQPPTLLTAAPESKKQPITDKTLYPKKPDITTSTQATNEDSLGKTKEVADPNKLRFSIAKKAELKKLVSGSVFRESDDESLSDNHERTSHGSKDHKSAVADPQTGQSSEKTGSSETVSGLFASAIRNVNMMNLPKSLVNQSANMPSKEDTATISKTSTPKIPDLSNLKLPLSLVVVPPKSQPSDATIPDDTTKSQESSHSVPDSPAVDISRADMALEMKLPLSLVTPRRRSSEHLESFKEQSPSSPVDSGGITGVPKSTESVFTNLSSQTKPQIESTATAPKSPTAVAVSGAMKLPLSLVLTPAMRAKAARKSIDTDDVTKSNTSEPEPTGTTSSSTISMLNKIASKLQLPTQLTLRKPEEEVVEGSQDNNVTSSALQSSPLSIVTGMDLLKGSKLPTSLVISGKQPRTEQSSKPTNNDVTPAKENVRNDRHSASFEALSPKVHRVNSPGHRPTSQTDTPNGNNRISSPKLPLGSSKSRKESPTLPRSYSKIRTQRGRSYSRSSSRSSSRSRSPRRRGRSRSRSPRRRTRSRSRSPRRDRRRRSPSPHHHRKRRYHSPDSPDRRSRRRRSRTPERRRRRSHSPTPSRSVSSSTSTSRSELSSGKPPSSQSSSQTSTTAGSHVRSKSPSSQFQSPKPTQKIAPATIDTIGTSQKYTAAHVNNNSSSCPASTSTSEQSAASTSVTDISSGSNFASEVVSSASASSVASSAGFGMSAPGVPTNSDVTSTGSEALIKSQSELLNPASSLLEEIGNSSASITADTTPTTSPAIETKWQKMIKSVSMTELQKIKKCVQFLINRKAVYAETGYLDPFLDSADERARMYSLSNPVFSHATVKGGTEMANLKVFFDVESEAVRERQEWEIWEGCPLDEECLCITHTLAKELLSRNDHTLAAGFEDTDEIHTLVLGIAYSNGVQYSSDEDRSDSAEHIVNLTPTPDLYRHIPHEIIDKMDGLLNNSSEIFSDELKLMRLKVKVRIEQEELGGRSEPNADMPQNESNSAVLTISSESDDDDVVVLVDERKRQLDIIELIMVDGAGDSTDEEDKIVDNKVPPAERNTGNTSEPASSVNSERDPVQKWPILETNENANGSHLNAADTADQPSKQIANNDKNPSNKETLVTETSLSCGPVAVGETTSYQLAIGTKSTRATGLNEEQKEEGKLPSKPECSTNIVNAEIANYVPSEHSQMTSTSHSPSATDHLVLKSTDADIQQVVDPKTVTTMSSDNIIQTLPVARSTHVIDQTGAVPGASGVNDSWSRLSSSHLSDASSKSLILSYTDTPLNISGREDCTNHAVPVELVVVSDEDEKNVVRATQSKDDEEKSCSVIPVQLEDQTPEPSLLHSTAVEIACPAETERISTAGDERGNSREQPSSDIPASLQVISLDTKPEEPVELVVIEDDTSDESDAEGHAPSSITSILYCDSTHSKPLVNAGDQEHMLKNSLEAIVDGIAKSTIGSKDTMDQQKPCLATSISPSHSTDNIHTLIQATQGESSKRDGTILTPSYQGTIQPGVSDENSHHGPSSSLETSRAITTPFCRAASIIPTTGIMQSNKVISPAHQLDVRSILAKIKSASKPKAKPSPNFECMSRSTREHLGESPGINNDNLEPGNNVIRLIPTKPSESNSEIDMSNIQTDTCSAEEKESFTSTPVSEKAAKPSLLEDTTLCSTEASENLTSTNAYTTPMNIVSSELHVNDPVNSPSSELSSELASKDLPTGNPVVCEDERESTGSRDSPICWDASDNECNSFDPPLLTSPINSSNSITGKNIKSCKSNTNDATLAVTINSGAAEIGKSEIVLANLTEKSTSSKLDKNAAFVYKDDKRFQRKSSERRSLLSYDDLLETIDVCEKKVLTCPNKNNGNKKLLKENRPIQPIGHNKASTVGTSTPAPSSKTMDETVAEGLSILRKETEVTVDPGLPQKQAPCSSPNMSTLQSTCSLSTSSQPAKRKAIEEIHPAYKTQKLEDNSAFESSALLATDLATLIAEEKLTFDEGVALLASKVPQGMINVSVDTQPYQKALPALSERLGKKLSTKDSNLTSRLGQKIPLLSPPPPVVPQDPTRKALLPTPTTSSSGEYLSAENYSVSSRLGEKLPIAPILDEAKKLVVTVDNTNQRRPISPSRLEKPRYDDQLGRMNLERNHSRYHTERWQNSRRHVRMQSDRFCEMPGLRRPEDSKYRRRARNAAAAGTVRK